MLQGGTYTNAYLPKRVSRKIYVLSPDSTVAIRNHVNLYTAEVLATTPSGETRVKIMQLTCQLLE